MEHIRALMKRLFRLFGLSYSLLLGAPLAAQVSPHAGIYTGAFSSPADNGGFALFIGDNGMGAVVGYNSVWGDGVFMDGIEVPSNGAISYTSAGGDIITGTVTNGNLSGTFVSGQTGNRGTIWASKRPATGIHSGSAGFYSGSVTGHTSGLARAILAADGLFVFSYTANWPSQESGGGYGTVNSQNQLINAYTVGGAYVYGSLNASTKSVSGTYVIPNYGNGTHTFTRSRSNSVTSGPTISQQPQSRTVAIGTNVTMTVVASGTPPLKYQWRKNGVAINGATSSSLSLSNVQDDHSGNYRVLVSNAYGTNLSNTAVLSVLHPPAVAQQPAGRTAPSGTTVTLSVGASGSNPMSYQWRRNGVNIPGATSPVLTLSNIQTNQVGNYRVLVSNPVGSVLSNPATVTVVPCDYSLSTNRVSFDFEGGEGSVSLSVSDICPWEIINTNDWIVITSETNGTGSTAVTYAIETNTNAFSRAGTIRIANRSHLVVQTGHFAPESIAGKIFFVRDDEASLLLVLNKTNSTYTVVPVSGDVEPDEGEYDYIKTGPASGVLSAGGVTVELEFLSPMKISGTVAFPEENEALEWEFTLIENRADFNKDGWADILFQNANGVLAAWQMNGTNFLSSTLLREGKPAATGWRAAAFHDYNDDGHADMLLHHEQGRTAIWYMDGTTVVRTKLLRDGFALHPSWRAVGVADWNNDGHGDILWHNEDGRLAVWFMNGETFVKSVLLRNGAKAGSGWQVVALADYNGDGQRDILWQHATSNKLAVWHMVGTEFISSSFLRNGLPLPAGWSVRAVIDANLDGQLDLVLQQTDGRVSVWFMQETERLGSTVLRGGKPAGTGWKVVGP